jgi:hypothetical protein
MPPGAVHKGQCPVSIGVVFRKLTPKTCTSPIERTANSTSSSIPAAHSRPARSLEYPRFAETPLEIEAVTTCILDHAKSRFRRCRNHIWFCTTTPPSYGSVVTQDYRKLLCSTTHVDAPKSGAGDGAEKETSASAMNSQK